METLLQDIRFGFRQLIRQPGFAALAIISMALGIGANTSIFSLVDTVLLRPLAVKEPSQLVELYGTLHNGADWSLQSYPNYKEYRDRNTVFSGLCVYRVVVSSLTVNNVQPARLGLSCLRKLLRYPRREADAWARIFARRRSDA